MRAPHAIWVLRGSVRRAAVLLVAGALFVSADSRSAAQGPTLASVLAASADYLTRFKQEVSAVVAEETYHQQVTTLGRLGRQVRDLRSDLLLVTLPDGRYVQFRDVFEVDGAPVRDREERLSGLFLNGSPSSMAQRERILETSARYNIGDVVRTINVPMMALMFLEPEFQGRFRFSRSRDTKPPALLTAGDGLPESEVWAIDYREVSRPTIVRRTDGRADQPAHGRFWIEPASGRVRMLELLIDDHDVASSVNVLFREQARIGLWLPAVMKERYDVNRAAQNIVIEGTATYANFRKFGVRTEEKLR